MSIQHGAVGLQADFVSRLMNLNPLVSIRFVLAQLITNFGMKNLGSAAWHTSKSCFAKIGQNLFRRFLGQEFEPIDFYCSPAFQVNLRIRVMECL